MIEPQNNRYCNIFAAWSDLATLIVCRYHWDFVHVYYYHCYFFSYRYQISVACSVALKTLDPLLCGIAVKRTMQKLRELYNGGPSKNEDKLVGDVVTLLQLMYSKVWPVEWEREEGGGGVSEWWSKRKQLILYFVQGVSLMVELVDQEWSDFLQTSLTRGVYV